MGHDKARNQIAQACGLLALDLPFAAELMDVDPGCESWRPAAEVTLGGVGLTMLMDERRQKHIREAIDGLYLDQRIHFEGVDLGSRSASPSDPRYVSGRLFKDSPFTAWVKSRPNMDLILSVPSGRTPASPISPFPRRARTREANRDTGSVVKTHPDALRDVEHRLTRT